MPACQRAQGGGLGSKQTAGAPHVFLPLTHGGRGNVKVSIAPPEEIPNWLYDLGLVT